MRNPNPIKIGVIGVGHLGNFHLQQLKTIPDVEITGLYDTSTERAETMAREHGVIAHRSLTDLLAASDAADIVTPTLTHFEVGQQALENNCHLFIEKPITQTIEQAQTLLENANQRQKLIQVGHIEQFNPAFRVLAGQPLAPRFIEAHRLAPFVDRGTDVPVILDLMIHDIDLILSLVQSPVCSISATGVKVASESVDIANARLEFENGAIANITSSRISMYKMRKLRIFQEKTYFSVDLLNRITEIYRVVDQAPAPGPDELVKPLDGNNKKYVVYRKPQIPKENALNQELRHFIDSIRQSAQPLVNGYSAAKALEVAIHIQQMIDRQAVGG
ncbi:MAG: Gfo/Idh/MocA family oxidoreductase [FCB group bacterium]|nr:Gfo/Idh/MocA family oxidoreductase [FCB group bacterium]